jgi:hypothetical protein
MTPGVISGVLRAQLRHEARDRCGYCQTQQALAYGPLEVDHIIPVAAGGTDDPRNLWLACRPCNQHKGAQTTGLDPQSGEPVRLFHPRLDPWHQHFAWSADGTYVIGITACGRTTVVALNLNNPFAVETRRHWVRAGWHPPQD